jgi:hypothetical protein
LLSPEALKSLFNIDKRLELAMANPCNKSRKNPMGMQALRMNLAGRPPGSGEISLIINELITKVLELQITKIEKGIRKRKLPKKSIHALVRGENF